jgi:hypothetical protein
MIMKNVLVLFLCVFTYMVSGQELIKDTTVFNFNEQRELMQGSERDQYEYEKTKLMWTLVGGVSYGVVSTANYHRTGNQDNLILNTGLSATSATYSIIKLVRLKRKINGLDYK